jgi:aspartyl-tRNA(Asn)/glutamyl-tRNA(Gln) amidotransferase subunit A
MSTVDAIAALAAGTTTSRALVEASLARIADASGEGSRAFVKVYAEQARLDADYADRLRRAGIVRSALDGVPISVKDLFDVAGDITRAGSVLLNDAAPARRDAIAVGRVRAAGAVIIGRTNMVEFAFGVVGANPHYGTPANPFDRKTRRVPGGSSSGAAVAVADGMGMIALGSDTRGSIRIPAALCGVVGFKPTTRRIPRDGVMPLSYTLDSVGPLADSVAACAITDAVLAAEPDLGLPALPTHGLRLLLPRSSLLTDLDAPVATAFDAALGALRRAGAHIDEIAMPAFDRQDEYFRGGGLAGAEAYAIHAPWRERVDEYDPRVGKRIALGGALAAAEYVAINRLRSACIDEVTALATPYDAMLLPSVACIAPTVTEATAGDDAYFRWNTRILRNAGIVNFFDGCAVSLPCHAPGNAPVGLMVCGVALRDRWVLAVAAAIERTLRDSRP